MKKNELRGLLAAYLMGGIAPLLTESGQEPQHARNSRGTKTSLEDAAAHKGLKAFEYPGGTVYALNQVNADRKARKLGYI